MKITKLEYQKKDPNRVNIYVDDKFATGLDVNDVVKLGLYKGQEITPEYLNKIISESEFGKLFNAALNFLSYRPRSEWEIRQMLTRKIKNNEIKNKKSTENKKYKIKNEDNLIEQIIAKLIQIKQINDHAFVQWWMEQRTTFRQKGNQAIKMELRQKGIDKKIIDEIFINSEGEKVSEFDRAWASIQKKVKLWSLEKLGPQKYKEKIYRFLLSRGFNYDTVNSVIEKLLAKE